MVSNIVTKIQRSQDQDTMQSPRAPQIIVIPHSMLQQKSLLRISPQVSPYKVICSSSQQPTLNRAVLSPNIIKSSSILPTPSISRPVATVVGHKRPVQSISPVFDEIKMEFEEDGTPARKRANLDHLSSEERLMRRKLKNRVAAQTARDKKKAQTDDMEIMISDLQAEKKHLFDENSRLQSVNNKLQVENVSLQNENIDLKSRLGENESSKQIVHLTDELKLELPPSPVSLPPSSPFSLPLPSPVSLPPSSPYSLPLPSPQSTTSVTHSDTPSPAPQQPPESAVLTYEPQQQDQGCHGLVRSNQSLRLSSQDLTPLGIVDQMDCLVLIWCALWILIKTKNVPPIITSPIKTTFSTPPAVIPLKKRSKNWTSWIQTISSTSRPPG